MTHDNRAIIIENLIKNKKDAIILEEKTKTIIIDIIHTINPINGTIEDFIAKIIEYDESKIISLYIYNQLYDCVIKLNENESGERIVPEYIARNDAFNRAIDYYSNIYFYIPDKKFTIIDILLISPPICKIPSIVTFLMHIMIGHDNYAMWIFFIALACISRTHLENKKITNFPIVKGDEYLYFKKTNQRPRYIIDVILEYNMGELQFPIYY